MTARRLLSAIVLVVLLASSTLSGRAVTPNGVAEAAWATPPTMTLKHLSTTASQQNEPAYLSNLDCTLEEYHLVASSTMHTGCFTETAYGQLDADSDTVIFNGTDEGLPLLPYSPGQVLAPWPRALDLVTLDAVPTGGSYISLYKNPMNSLRDQRNLALQLTAKQLSAPPELPLKDSTGQRLVINAQSLAFADSGSWIVAEVLGSSFMRINLATLEMKPFAPVYARLGSPGLDESSVTISPDGRYVAIENTYAGEFKVYDLKQCAGSVCPSYNYWPFIKNQVDSLMYLSHVRFVNGGLLSFEATTKSSASGGLYELAPTSGIHSLIDYLGLGDSYSSGQGAYDYLASTDSADNRCHLSSHSYPLLLTHDLFTAAGGHSVACSGAVMHDVGDTSDSYHGQVRGVADWKDLSAQQPALLASIMTNYLPGYVSQQRFVAQYQPAIITVGIGGNNVGFGNILERCIEPKTSLHLISNTCFATYEDRQELLALVKKTGKDLQRLYQQLQRQDPGGNLYVIGYPQISVDNGSCALNVHFNTSELEFADELVDQINSAINSAASSAGAHYVDITNALAGHRLCEARGSNIAVNGLTAGHDSGVGDFSFLGSESYHPNALGQQLIEQAILTQTNHFTLPSTASNPVPKPVSPSFLSVPPTNRPFSQLVITRGITASQLRHGQTAPLTLDSLSHGLSDGTYTVRLDGSQGQVIGSVSAGSGSLTIPDSTPPGIHTIDITGSNQAGEPVDISQNVSIDAPQGSSCGLLAESGQDTDGDGIDDACDPMIGAPSGGTVSPPPGQQAGTETTSPAAASASTEVRTAASVVIQPAAQSSQVTSIKAGHVLGTSVGAPKPFHLSPQLQLQRSFRGPTPSRWPQLRILQWRRWLVGGLVTAAGAIITDRWLRQKSKAKSHQILVQP